MTFKERFYGIITFISNMKEFSKNNTYHYNFNFKFFPSNVNLKLFIQNFNTFLWKQAFATRVLLNNFSCNVI